jgi:hypothetical protein
MNQCTKQSCHISCIKIKRSRGICLLVCERSQKCDECDIKQSLQHVAASVSTEENEGSEGLSNERYLVVVSIIHVSGFLSLAGSSIIVYLVSNKLNSVYHRLSISDLLFTNVIVLNSYLLPMDTGFPL